MRLVRSVGFLFKAPLIVLFLFIINLMTSPGHWWFQWPALGLGFAWVMILFRVMRAIVVRESVVLFGRGARPLFELARSPAAATSRSASPSSH